MAMYTMDENHLGQLIQKPATIMPIIASPHMIPSSAKPMESLKAIIQIGV